MAHRARRRATLSTAVVALVLSTLGATPLSAQDDEDETALIGYRALDASDAADGWVDPVYELGLEEVDLVPLPEFDFTTLHDSEVFASGIDWIDVVDGTLDEQAYRHQRVLQVKTTLERTESGVATEVLRLGPVLQDLDARVAVELAHEQRLLDEIRQYNEAIAELAVRAFVGDEQLDESALLEPTSITGESRVRTREVRDSQFREIETREDEHARRRRIRINLQRERDVLHERREGLRSKRRRLLEDIRDMRHLAEQTEGAYRNALHDRLVKPVVGTNMQLVALNAYVIAERIMAIERPACGIEWWMLAGIGEIESGHGQFGSATLDINGSATDSITGPALDGRILSGSEFLEDGTPAPVATVRTETSPVPTAGDEVVDEENGEDVPVVQRLALITDTDGGELDGDATYDRAVGPMQFIPQTWRQYEADANNDDVSDPQNIYDAALASANYLCVAAGSMTSDEGQQRAYFAYNHDEVYSEAVTVASHRYRERIELPSDPEGSATPLGIHEHDPGPRSDPPRDDSGH